MELIIHSEKDFQDAVSKINGTKEAVKMIFEEGVQIKHPDCPVMIVSQNSLQIEGNGAELLGEGLGDAMNISGKNISVCGLKVSGYFMGINIRAAEQNVKDVSIIRCEFRDIVSECISAGITESGRVIDGIDIEECFFEAPRRERGGHCSTATNVTTAFYNGAGQPIHNVTLRNVRWRKNRLVGNPKDGNLFSLGFTAHGCCNHAFYENKEMDKSSYNDVSHSLQENIYVEDNEIDGVYDIGITALTGLAGRFDSEIRNVVITGNRIIYNNTAINVGTTNVPSFGDLKRHYTRNVLIKNNVCIPKKPGPNEPQIGIMLFTIRAESLKIDCEECHMEDIVVVDNDITGREVGIALQAVHATQDLPNPSRLSNITLKRVTIMNNTIRNAQRAIRIFTSKLEGRTDDFWGYPLPPYDAKLPFSTRCEHCKIDEITVRDNTIIEYDCALTLGAAWGCGHGFIKDSTVGPNLIFSGNKLDGGRKVFCYDKYVTDNMLYEDAIGVDNHVIGHFDI